VKPEFGERTKAKRDLKASRSIVGRSQQTSPLFIVGQQAFVQRYISPIQSGAETGHSRTLRDLKAPMELRQVLECGVCAPLWYSVVVTDPRT
jgi:hypothetical protein